MDFGKEIRKRCIGASLIHLLVAVEVFGSVFDFNPRYDWLMVSVLVLGPIIFFIDIAIIAKKWEVSENGN
jgi:uncharacterized membrane protein YoaT (DUF817 family)